jgi:spermidine synthase
MPWDLIATAAHDDAHLELFRKDGVFMIRANGLELMNGFAHESETALGRLAADLARVESPRILVGGLGLGYTTAALIDALSDRAQITVAEFSPAVIDWFHAHVRPTVLPLMPQNLEIIETDVLAHLWAAPRYDLILLDIDNGPEPLVRAGNGTLYSAEGLRVLRAGVADDGAVLLWSGFEAPDFEARCRDAGFIVTRRVVANGTRAELDHHIYCLESKSSG